MATTTSLGVVADMARLLGFGVKVADRAGRIAKEGSVDAGLERYAERLVKLAEKVQDDIRSDPSSSVASPPPPPAQDLGTEELLGLASESHGISEALLGLLSSMSPPRPADGKPHTRHSIKSAVKATLRKDQLDDLEGRLRYAEQGMRMGLYARICTRSNNMITEINKKVEALVQEFRDSRNELFERICQEAEDTRQHVLNVAKEESAKRESFSPDARERLRASLRFPEINARHNQLRSSPGHEGTFEWIFSGPADYGQAADGQAASAPKPGSFPGWLSSDSSDVYWISGKPGSGKSTLVNHLVSHAETRTRLETWRPGSDPIIISHFFSRAGPNLLQKSTKGFLCSLLYRLLLGRDHLADALLQNQEDPDPKYTHADWCEPELEAACISSMRLLDRPVCLFVDGIDELDPTDFANDGLGAQSRFLGLLARLRGNNSQLKVCIASRPETAIRAHVSSQSRGLQLQDLTRRDLKLYAQSRLDLFWPRAQDGQGDGDREKTVEALTDKADGVFAWLCLAVMRVNRCLMDNNTPEEIHKRVDGLSRDIDQLRHDVIGDGL